MNPCESPFDMMTSSGRSELFGGGGGAPTTHDVNHYHVSEDLCKLSSTGSSVSSYNSGGVKKSNARYQIGNMNVGGLGGGYGNESDTSSAYHSSNNQNNTIGASLSLREQFNKTKLSNHSQLLNNTAGNNKNKRTNRPVIDLMTASDCAM